ncbi:hemolysin family protein [Cellulomonas sp. ATA003]|uniref:hemolysin family protein n=1 Tax=Cellulomonas sp. ATA003 TaxID=3073064 RepID=UPI002873393A|nr:hemolysin family protein [Cellulomonas sp. ATA003]WNB84596.1 hemolysin family protein [Cellulomonas sp. ATA003]
MTAVLTSARLASAGLTDAVLAGPHAVATAVSPAVTDGLPVGLLVTVAALGFGLAALLSAGESALLQVTRAAVSELVAQGHPHAGRVRRLTEEPTDSAASAAFVRLIAEMSATACVVLALTATDLAWWAVLLLSVVVSGLVALILVRISPRSLGRRHPVRVLTMLSALLSVVRMLPIGRLAPEVRRTGEVDEDELRAMVARMSESHGLEEEERDMFRSVFELGDTLTREVMVPRTEMITAESTTPLRKALSLMLRSGYSRVPVVGTSVDDLRGVLYLKDLIRRLQDSPGSGEDPVAHLARPAVFVPESKPVDDLLREMQAASSHIAVVVDEYGGIAGLVTIEDALEEIVGELTDEHDRSGPEVEDLGDGTFRVPARLPVDEVGELFDLDLEDDEVDTAGGLLAKALGKVPLLGASGEIHGLHLTAERVEGRRKQLATVLVRLAAPADDRDDIPQTTPGASR